MKISVDIAANIVRSIAFGTAYPSNALGFDKNYETAQSLQSLMELGSVWRQAVLQCVYSRCEIKISLLSSFDVSFPLLPSIEAKALDHAQDQVKSLQIRVGHSMLTSSNVMDAAFWEPLDSRKLAHVENLVIEISGSQKSAKNLQVPAMAYIELSKHIKQLVPNPSTVDIKYGMARYPMDSDELTQFSSIFEALYPKVKLCQSSNISIMPNEANFYPFLGLTSIDITWNEGVARKLDTVHANSSRLQNLSVQCKDGDSLEQLFVSNTGDVIEYPNLQKLELVSWGSHETSSLISTPEHGAPLPNLRYLKIDMLDPFATDILFRGNNQSLEYLYIRCGEDTFDTFTQYDVFVKNKLIALKELTVYPMHTDTSTYIPPAELADLVFGAAPNVEQITIKGRFASADLFEHMPSKVQLNSLTKFTIWPAKMDLCDLVFLLSDAPALEVLECELLTIGSDLEKLSHDKQIDYVLDNCRSIGKKFSKVAARDHGADTENKSVALMLVAIMCPNFRSMDLVCDDTSDCQKYQSCISKAKQTSPFDRFASQLDRILIQRITFSTEYFFKNIDF